MRSLTSAPRLVPHLAAHCRPLADPTEALFDLPLEGPGPVLNSVEMVQVNLLDGYPASARHRPQ